MPQTVLILGAAGRAGRASATAFQNAGWTVRQQVRPGRATPAAAIHCDATDAEALTNAARGADVIIHALNAPYPAWRRELPRLTKAVIAAARASGATVLIPGNIYNYGTKLPPVLREDTPHSADTRKGKLRVEMEEAFRASGVPTIILRAGDFLEASATGNWFDSVIAKHADRGRAVYLGPVDLPHAWAYLPDFARALVGLAEARGGLARFEDVGFPGYTLTGQELSDAIAGAVGRPMRLRRFPWLALRLAAPFWPMGRDLVEMAYLWKRPHQIDGGKLSRLLPDFHPTPLADAIADCVRLAEIHPDQPVVRAGGAFAADQAV